MPNLTPTPSWDDVTAWEKTTVADGVQMNAPAQALVNRTEFLREHTPVPYVDGVEYKINQRVMLDSGDIVKNTIEGNTANPNIDMTGWELGNSADQIFDESGKSQQEINDSLNGISYAPDLPKNRRLQIIAGSIRNTGDGWKWISDAAHTPIGFTPTITVSGVNITINYGFTAKRVVSLVATPDETFAGLGFIVGGSVGTTFTNLQIKAPLAFTVDAVSGAITAPAYVANAISAALGSGTCSVTHPTVGVTGDAPAVSRIGVTKPDQTEVTLSYGPTQTIIYGVGDLDGQISYNGTGWTYTGELKTIPTMSWVTGGADAYLLVTHQQADVFNINIQSRTTLNTKVAGVSGTEFRVRFYDAAGNLLLTPTADMQFLFSRRANLSKSALRGLFSVRRGYAGILPADLVSASGNIWIYGVMEV